jgi:hypothetical protein
MRLGIKIVLVCVSLAALISSFCLAKEITGEETAIASLSGYDYRKQITIDGTTAGAQTNYQMQLKVDRTYPVNLTLLNERVYAFTIPGGSGWTERDFSSTVPSNTKMALILLRSTTYGDVCFKAKSTDSNYVTTSMGNTADYCDGNLFVIVPVSNCKVWTQNAGSSGAFYVYVVGYITEGDTGNTFFEMFNNQSKVVSAQNPTDWTNVDISSLKQENEDKTIKGAYIAVDSNADQDLYFRASGSSEGGVLWESDTSDPGTHLLGFIPVGSNGTFQYKTGGTNVNIYVLGLIHSCPAAQSDKMVIYNAETIIPMYADSNWHAITPDWLGAKAYYITGIKSPNALNTFKTRPYGSTMTQNYLKKDSCGGLPILTKPGTDNKIEYWSNAYANGYLYCNLITIYSASFTPTGGNLFIHYSMCQSDFNDVCFTKSDGETLLDYRGFPTTSNEERCVFCVEFDSIPTSPSSANFYVYYGNSGAS